MSRSRKDDSRFQPSPALGLQSSPSRDQHHHGPTGPGVNFPVVGGHNYIRSKAKEKDRTGYMAKDRAKNTNPTEIRGHGFTPEHANFRNPIGNNISDNVLAARELSWADEVELSMTNNGSQRPNEKPTPTPKTANSQVQSAVDAKATVLLNDVGQNKLTEEAEKALPKNVNPNPCSNGKTRPDKDHDQANYKRVNCPQPRRGSRKKTLSLNPEEREALENLIEEVLMDGAIDSDSASSDEDVEQSDSWKNVDVSSGGIDGGSGVGNVVEVEQKARGDKGKMGRKYYPGQLKVALKHMTELPPRFSRKLKKAEKYLELNTMRNSATATGRIEEEDEESLALARDDKYPSVSPRPLERDKDKGKSKEQHVKEFKRSIRTLLRDHNQYAEDSNAANPVTSIHPPGAIICEDFERETLNIQSPQSADLTHEVPSSVQNLMLAAKVFSAMDVNQNMPSGEIFHQENSFHETEAVSPGSHLMTGNFAGSDLVGQRYTSPYAVPDAGGSGGGSGSQYLVNVPEFLPTRMLPNYQMQEVLSPCEQQQYQTSLLPDHSAGTLLGSGGEHILVPQHGVTHEQMLVVGQSSPGLGTTSAMGESMSSKMVDLSVHGSLNENLMSPLTSAFVSGDIQVSLSTLPSSGVMPFYQSPNLPLPPASYGYPIQVPYSTKQYCFIPPAPPPQTLPRTYYPQDQPHYQPDSMQYKTVLPEWGYQNPKQRFATTVVTPPTYSAYPNLGSTGLPYAGNEPSGPPISQFNPNFRQRKKQPGSSFNPRSMGNLSNVSAGKFSSQRSRLMEGSPLMNRMGPRQSFQEGAEPFVQPESGVTGPTFGDAALKRPPYMTRSRTSGDGQTSYPGRRDNRNFVSDKYASSQRAFVTDGKKEVRHVTLKPKQAKPNRSSARSRNDITLAPLHPLKPYHPSDLSEEGLESPDNFGDVESGADDWSTDNYDQEVSKKERTEKEASVDNAIKEAEGLKEENIILDVPLEILEETQLPGFVEIQQSVSQGDAFDVGEEESLQSSGGMVPSSSDQFVVGYEAGGDAASECSLLPSGNQSATSDSAVSSVVNHQPCEEPSCLGGEMLDQQSLKEVDRLSLAVENLKRIAVQSKRTLSITDCYDPSSGTVDRPIVEEATGLESSPAMEVPAEVGSRGVDVGTEVTTFDIDIQDGVVRTFDPSSCSNTDLEGLTVIFGLEFILRLRDMFSATQDHNSLDVKLRRSVRLSRTVLSQIYMEYLAQDISSDIQDVLWTSEDGSLDSTPMPAEHLAENSVALSLGDEQTLEEPADCSVADVHVACSDQLDNDVKDC